MRPDLPQKLGSEFWFSLFMIVLGCGMAIFGIALSSGYKTFIGGFVILLFTIRLVKRVRDVRLARNLTTNPDIARIYYGSGQDEGREA